MDQRKRLAGIGASTEGVYDEAGALQRARHEFRNASFVLDQEYTQFNVPTLGNVRSPRR
jgi:hypothetical protein